MGPQRPAQQLGDAGAASPAHTTPEYQKIFDASKAEQKAGQPGNWPSTFCIPEGMPAMMATSTIRSEEIIIKPDTTILTSHNNDINIGGSTPTARR